MRAMARPSGTVSRTTFAAVLRIAELLGANASESALPDVAAAIAKATDARGAAIGLFDASATEIQIQAVANPDGGLPLASGMSVPSEWISQAGPFAGTRCYCTTPDQLGLSAVVLVVPDDPSRGISPDTEDVCRFAAEQVALRLGATRALVHHTARLAQLDGQRRLIEMVLEGRGLSALARELAAQVGNPVIVSDAVFHHVAHSPDQELTDEHRREALAEGGPPRRVLNDPAVWQELARVARSDHALFLKTFPQHGWVQRRVQAPIFVGSDLLGRITIAETNRTVTDTDMEILNDATIAFALELMKQRAMLETEHRLRADFLRDLLSITGEHDPESTIARAGFLGIDLLRSWDLLVVELDDVADDVAPDTSEHDGPRRRIFEAVRRAVAWRCPQSVAAVHGSSVVVLVPTDGIVTCAARTLAEHSLDDVRRLFPEVTLSVGIGPTCRKSDDFPSSFARARRALEVVRSLGHQGRVVALEDLGVYGLLFRSDDRGEMIGFARRTLGTLIEHDERHGTSLVQTLRVYLEENYSHRRTAERLFIHVNTLSARMTKIADVTQYDLQDATLRLNLHLALRILHLAGAIGDPPGAAQG